nr:MAG TPA: hypothetical protein [Caudoviricetes sp.]
MDYYGYICEEPESRTGDVFVPGRLLLFICV